MSAESIRAFGFLDRTVERDPEDHPGHPAATPALVELLRQWRAGERALATLEPGTEAWMRIQVEVERLRQLYQDASDALSRQDEAASTEEAASAD